MTKRLASNCNCPCEPDNLQNTWITWMELDTKQY